MIHSFIYSFIHSFIQSFIYSFIYSFIHFFIHSFIYSIVPLLIHSFIYSFIHLFIHSFIHSFIQTHCCSAKTCCLICHLTRHLIHHLICHLPRHCGVFSVTPFVYHVPGKSFGDHKQRIRFEAFSAFKRLISVDSLFGISSYRNMYSPAVFTKNNSDVLLGRSIYREYQATFHNFLLDQQT